MLFGLMARRSRLASKTGNRVRKDVYYNLYCEVGAASYQIPLLLCDSVSRPPMQQAAESCSRYEQPRGEFWSLGSSCDTGLDPLNYPHTFFQRKELSRL